MNRRMGRSIMLSDAKSDVMSGESSRSRGMPGVVEGVAKQVVPYAFSNHASSPQIGYKSPFSEVLSL
jgi:hypothetical protein